MRRILPTGQRVGVPSRLAKEVPMEIVHPLCCGLDIHKRSIQACLVSTDAAGRAQRTPGSSAR